MRTHTTVRDLVGLTAVMAIVIGLVTARTLYFVHTETNYHALLAQSASQHARDLRVAHVSTR